MYIYIYIYAYTVYVLYVHIYIYIYIYKSSRPPRRPTGWPRACGAWAGTGGLRYSEL